MTDHIVVFDGTERLVGRSIRVHIDDASSFTLFGRVLTSGFEFTSEPSRAMEADEAPSYPVPLDFAPPEETKRIGLPVV